MNNVDEVDEDQTELIGSVCVGERGSAQKAVVVIDGICDEPSFIGEMYVVQSHLCVSASNVTHQLRSVSGASGAMQPE